MANWEPVSGGRARAVHLTDGSAPWVRVSDDGTVHFFEVAAAGDLEGAAPACDLQGALDRLTALDAIDIICRSLGGEDPGPVKDE